MAATGVKMAAREGGDGLSGSGSKVRIFKQDPSVKTMGHRYSVLILHYSTKDSLDQCPMPINADQNHGIDPKCLSTLIIVIQC